MTCLHGGVHAKKTGASIDYGGKKCANVLSPRLSMLEVPVPNHPDLSKFPKSDKRLLVLVPKAVTQRG